MRLAQLVVCSAINCRFCLYAKIVNHTQFWQHLVKNSRRHHVLHNQSGKTEKAIHAYFVQRHSYLYIVSYQLIILNKIKSCIKVSNYEQTVCAYKLPVLHCINVDCGYHPSMITQCVSIVHADFNNAASK
ncbi:conserved hypothetical protein [Trichinella spiralis]|uniref:hypothetical protein n=1 Tax=Trichinella spiralis TaxID=6334 RepID=UPI0001EFB2A9|nr:conserved hypothetical protein [Trichinella spiralis]